MASSRMLKRGVAVRCTPLIVNDVMGQILRGMPQQIVYPGQPALTPTLIGDELRRNWAKSSVAELMTRIRISMPQDNPGSLSLQSAADLVAFLLQMANYPAGSRELPRDPTLSEDVVFSE